MSSNKEGSGSRIYLVTRDIMYLLATNIWFMVTILPLIIYFFKAGEGITIPMISFLGILIGPALTTMFSVLGRFMRKDHTSAIRDYFYFYKINFPQGIFVAAVMNIALMIAYTDIGYFFSKGMNVLAYLCILIIILIGSICLYIYPILSRVNIKILDLFKISILLVFKKLYITLTNISLLIIGFALIKLTSLSLFAILFGASAICYMILTMESGILLQVEKFITEKYKENTII